VCSWVQNYVAVTIQYYVFLTLDVCFLSAKLRVCPTLDVCPDYMAG
jgi:hypothetical protein